MKQNALVVILIITTLILGCNDKSKKNSNDESSANKELEVVSDDNENNIGTKNYAVIWNWKKEWEYEFVNNLADISAEMTDLHEKGILHNAYIDKDTISGKFEHSNISCFIKAKSKEEAHSILNDLLLVKKGISKYKIHPVGTLWLGRNADAETNNISTKTYVTVWSSIEEIDQANDNKLITKQTKSIVKLWNEGTIENVYWDLNIADNTYHSDEITEFVFFINAESEIDAKEICNNLPFTKENKVSFLIKHVGNFWLGANY